LSPRSSTPLRVLALAAIVTSALIGASGRAETAKPTPAPSTIQAPVSDEPAATTASFGDWVMRCERTGEGDKAVRVCEAGQTIQVQGQAAPIAQIGIGRLTAGEPLRITIVLPPNIALPSNVRVVADEKDESGIELAWRRCLPGGCVADAKLEPETIKYWRGRSAAGKLSFKDAAGRDLTIPFSFRGLAQSLDALAKERRPQPQ
jgi:invasion protein IalB